MTKLSPTRLSLIYIITSIFYGPASIFIGLAQTTGGGDTGDASYFLPSGARNQELIDQEFNRAELVSTSMASVGILLGLLCAVMLVISHRKGTLGRAALLVHLALIFFMLVGYALVIAIMRHP